MQLRFMEILLGVYNNNNNFHQVGFGMFSGLVNSLTRRWLQVKTVWILDILLSICMYQNPFVVDMFGCTSITSMAKNMEENKFLLCQQQK